MSYQISKTNQKWLLGVVEDATSTAGWKADAVAFSLSRKRADGDPDLLAAAVFENFSGPGRVADFSFAMLNGNRMNRGIIDAFLNLAFHPRALSLDGLWMQAPEHNLISQRAMLAIGASFQFRKRGGAADGSDAIVFFMERPGVPAPAARASTTEDRDED